MLPIVGMLIVPLSPKRDGEPLRVLILGRISTVRQREETIEASYRFQQAGYLD
jgi:hypothetical protein